MVAENYYNASPVVLDRVKQITGKDFRFYQADIDVYKRQDMNSAVVKVSNKVDQTTSSLPSTCMTPSIIEYTLNTVSYTHLDVYKRQRQRGALCCSTMWSG